MKWKAATLILAAALSVVLIIALLYFVVSSRFAVRQLDSAAIVTQVKQLKELSTVRYSIERVVGMTEAKVPIGSESILLMVQGEVEAGVDLGQITNRDIQIYDKHSVYVHLPPAKILSAYLDERQTKVWDRHITWWTPWVPYDSDLEHKARLAALAQVNQAALRMGILAQAQDYARRAIRDLFSALGLQASFPDQAT